MRCLALVLAAAGLTGIAAAQPATQFRFANGTNQITVAPGTAVPLSLYATGMPNSGANIPWTTPPGTGQIGQYNGFMSVAMDINATGGAWSGLTIPPGMGYQQPPFGSAGTPSGSSVRDINITVGFSAPIHGNVLLLWQGTITVGTEDVSMSTLILPFFGNIGVEVNLSGITPGLGMSQYLATTNGSAIIHVPAPAASVLLVFAGVVGARRRRQE